uniref:Uncharacterized protein n=1 Tax=Anguilla anguilla TaxID=7936 RepID=A0A0E9X8Q2_ANGAN
MKYGSKPSEIFTNLGQILFYTLLILSGALEPMKYSQKVQNPPLVILAGSIKPGKINRAQKSI